MSKVFRIDEMTHADAIEMANEDKSLMSMLGGTVDAIIARPIETIKSLTQMWFTLNTEVGAYYDNNGF
jgi:hypothetical protein